MICASVPAMRALYTHYYGADAPSESAMALQASKMPQMPPTNGNMAVSRLRTTRLPHDPRTTNTWRSHAPREGHTISRVEVRRNSDVQREVAAVQREVADGKVSGEGSKRWADIMVMSTIDVHLEDMSPQPSDDESDFTW